MKYFTWRNLFVVLVLLVLVWYVFNHQQQAHDAVWRFKNQVFG